MTWAPAGPERFGLSDLGAPAPAAASTGLAALSTPSAAAANAGKLLHPDNPYFVWCLLAGVTFGLMAFSTSGTVRVGKTKLTGAVGVGST